MSNRSLIEINHDYWHVLDSHPLDFLAALQRYLSSADNDNAEALRRFGVKVVGMRHHSDKFVIDATAEGFPPQYLKGAVQ